MTLTLGRGPHLLHHFKGLVTKYLWVKFHNSTVNSVRDISQSSIFQYFKVTLWPWPWVKVNTNSMVWKVLPQSTLGPSFITLLLVVSEILSMFEFVTSGRTDGRRTPEGHYIDSLCWHTWANIMCISYLYPLMLLVYIWKTQPWWLVMEPRWGTMYSLVQFFMTCEIYDQVEHWLVHHALLLCLKHQQFPVNPWKSLESAGFCLFIPFKKHC